MASAADAPVIAATLTEGFEGYRAWAPPEWSPPTSDEEETFLAAALARSDVWFLLAIAHAEAVGHVAMSPFTMVQREPPPTGTTNLWQLFVRPPWQGRGVATRLMRTAEAEARRRGFTRIRLWTPRDAARARRFYEREGWAATGAARGSALVGCPLSSTHERSPTQAEATDHAGPRWDQAKREREARESSHLSREPAVAGRHVACERCESHPS